MALAPVQTITIREFTSNLRQEIEIRSQENVKKQAPQCRVVLTEIVYYETRGGRRDKGYTLVFGKRKGQLFHVAQFFLTHRVLRDILHYAKYPAHEIFGLGQ